MKVAILLRIVAGNKDRAFNKYIMYLFEDMISHLIFQLLLILLLTLLLALLFTSLYYLIVTATRSGIGAASLDIYKFGHSARTLASSLRSVEFVNSQVNLFKKMIWKLD